MWGCREGGGLQSQTEEKKRMNPEAFFFNLCFLLGVLCDRGKAVCTDIDLGAKMLKVSSHPWLK